MRVRLYSATVGWVVLPPGEGSPTIHPDPPARTPAWWVNSPTLRGHAGRPNPVARHPREPPAPSPRIPPDPPHGRPRHGEIRKPLVTRGHRGQRRARPRGGGLHEGRPPRDREVAEDIRRGKRAQEGHAPAIGDVDADLLHQPGGRGSRPRTEESARRREGRAARAFRRRRSVRVRRAGRPTLRPA